MSPALVAGVPWQEVLGHRVELGDPPSGAAGTSGTWGASTWDGGLWGSGWAPLFRDITPAVLSVHTSSGAEGLALSPGVGTVELELYDLNGMFSPDGSVDWLLGLHVRGFVTPAGRAQSPAFYGIIDKAEAGGTFALPVVAVTAYDTRSLIGAARTATPISDVAENVQTRIAKVLTEAGLPATHQVIEGDLTPLMADDGLELGDLFSRTVESAAGLAWSDGAGRIHTRNRDWVYGTGTNYAAYIYAGSPGGTPPPEIPGTNVGEAVVVPYNGKVEAGVEMPPVGIDHLHRFALPTWDVNSVPGADSLHLYGLPNIYIMHVVPAGPGMIVFAAAWDSVGSGYDLWVTSSAFAIPPPGAPLWFSYTCKYNNGAGQSFHDYWYAPWTSAGRPEEPPPEEWAPLTGLPGTPGSGILAAPITYRWGGGDRTIVVSPTYAYESPLELLDLELREADTFRVVGKCDAQQLTALNNGAAGALFTDAQSNVWTATPPAAWRIAESMRIPVAQTTDLSASQAISTVANQVTYANRADPPVSVTLFDLESVARYGARQGGADDLACDLALLEDLAAWHLALHREPFMVCEGATVTVYDVDTAGIAALELGDVVVIGRADPEGARWELTGIVAGIDLDITPDTFEIAVTVTDAAGLGGADGLWNSGTWSFNRWAA